MNKILLIDGHSILNRAFYGLPDLTNYEGLHTNAVLGFLNIIFKIMDEEKPDHMCVAFDVHEPTFRHLKYSAYKGTRKPMQEDMRQMILSVRYQEWQNGMVMQLLLYRVTEIFYSLQRIQYLCVSQRQKQPEQR